eukprot:Gb_00499 [translate_table: standard]
MKSAGEDNKSFNYAVYIEQGKRIHYVDIDAMISEVLKCGKESGKNITGFTVESIEQLMPLAIVVERVAIAWKIQVSLNISLLIGSVTSRFGLDGKVGSLFCRVPLGPA